ncbi:hypothetical protein, partial [Haloferula sp.]|uniref:hypothetical protein n=1 Tax=Haloferula sp. TaxID=2497595 RepID=UPI003C76AAFB
GRVFRGAKSNRKSTTDGLNHVPFGSVKVSSLFSQLGVILSGYGGEASFGRPSPQESVNPLVVAMLEEIWNE